MLIFTILLSIIANIGIGAISCGLASITMNMFNEDYENYLARLNFLQTIILFSFGVLAIFTIPYAIIKSDKNIIKRTRFKLGENVKIKKNEIEKHYSKESAIHRENWVYKVNSMSVRNGRLVYTIAHDGGMIIRLYSSDVEKVLSRKERIKNLC